MLSHVDESGNARMVDITRKPATARTAVAEGFIYMSGEALEAVRGNTLKKGDALATARIAGIMAAKNTPRAIPLCHDIHLTGCEIGFTLGDGWIRAECGVRCQASTGAEMEALSGVAGALLTVYDMCKSVDKHMRIDGVRLLSKTGGRSGDVTLAGGSPGQ